MRKFVPKDNRQELLTLNDNTYKMWLTKEEIEDGVKKMAKWLDMNFKDVEEKPILMEVQTGGKYFFVDLHRKLNIDIHVDAIGVTSYPEIEVRTIPHITSLQRSNIYKRDIILVEDIIDSGSTTNFLKKTFLAWGASSVTIIAIVIRLPNSNKISFCDQACFVFEGDEWLVGYGMDDNQLGRQLNEIYYKIS